MDGVERLRGADPINDELEVGFNQPFEEGWLRAEFVGRIIMVLFTAAGLAGLLGHGPYSHHTAKSAESGLAIDFEPIARANASTQVTFHIDNPTEQKTMDLFISTNVVEPMGLQHILPDPVSSKVVQNGVVFTMGVPSGTIDAEVRIVLMPDTFGPHQLEARLDDHAPLKWTQFIVP